MGFATDEEKKLAESTAIDLEMGGATGRREKADQNHAQNPLRITTMMRVDTCWCNIVGETLAPLTVN